MNTPTKSGWYWAMIDGDWEIVMLNQINQVGRIGDAIAYKPSSIQQWGERVERKEASI